MHMSRRAYLVTGVALLCAAVVVALLIQLLGGGLIEVVEANQTRPNGGGFVVSLALTGSLAALIAPALLIAGGIVCFILRCRAETSR